MKNRINGKLNLMRQTDRESEGKREREGEREREREREKEREGERDRGREREREMGRERERRDQGGGSKKYPLSEHWGELT